MINDKQVERYLKDLAFNMLNTLDHTPEDMVRLEKDLLPSAEFHNGLQRPNKRPPTVVYISINGILWRLEKGKRWVKH